MNLKSHKNWIPIHIFPKDSIIIKLLTDNTKLNWKNQLNQSDLFLKIFLPEKEDKKISVRLKDSIRNKKWCKIKDVTNNIRSVSIFIRYAYSKIGDLKA